MIKVDEEFKPGHPWGPLGNNILSSIKMTIKFEFMDRGNIGTIFRRTD